MNRSPIAVLTIVAVLALALSVSACGRKGDPVLPKEQRNTFPDQYPKSTQPQGGVFSGT
ncbi:lipoprotein [Dongia sp.]|uniref:LPS translocon maturation chaperone LptM n=1 Tax=Dongia sp. TaxID=1977262 RepID=UPI0035AF8612